MISEGFSEGFAVSIRFFRFRWGYSVYLVEGGRVDGR